MFSLLHFFIRDLVRIDFLLLNLTFGEKSHLFIYEERHQPCIHCHLYRYGKCPVLQSAFLGLRQSDIRISKEFSKELWLLPYEK